MKRKTILTFLAILLLSPPLLANKKLNIVTTTADLASLVQYIGQDKVKITNLSKGTQDPHFIEPRPSMVVKLRRADMLVIVGMDLDIWAKSIIDIARNHRIRPGNEGYLDASKSIKKQEVPKGKIDASMGDIHAQGNPHYWIDPENARLIAIDITKKLSEISPESATYFKANLKSFLAKLDNKMNSWNKILAPFKGSKIITFHRSWSYFAKQFGLEIAAAIEPKPGIPPSPGDLKKVVQTIENENVKIILMEIFYDPKPAQFIAKQSGVKVVIVPNSVGGISGVEDYFGLIDFIVSKIAKNLN